ARSGHRVHAVGPGAHRLAAERDVAGKGDLRRGVGAEPPVVTKRHQRPGVLLPEDEPTPFGRATVGHLDVEPALTEGRCARRTLLAADEDLISEKEEPESDERTDNTEECPFHPTTLPQSKCTRSQDLTTRSKT